MGGYLKQTTIEARMGFTKNRAKLKLIVRRFLEPLVTYTVCTAPGPLVTGTVCAGPVAAAVGVVVVEMASGLGATFGVQYAK